MNELLKEDFINLCLNKKPITTYMLNDIKNDFVEKNNMNDISLNFVKSIHKSFDSNSKDYMNTYLEGFGGYSNDKINMYRTKLMLYYLYKFKKDYVEQLDHNQIGTFNVTCINTLIHELVHAKQEQIVKGIIESKDVIQKILKADFIINDEKFYDMYYEYFISEYNANLEASIYINKLLNNTTLKHLNNNETLEIIKKAYDDQPIALTFINLINHDINDYNYQQLDSKEKILYGFPRR